ncbi:MAG: site-2 protease family protein, partial [Acidobacteria bacterium]
SIVTEPRVVAREVSKCAACATELAPTMLACPSCQTLVHSSVLKDLAATAEARRAAQDLVGARDAWNRALGLLPTGTQQHDAVRERVKALNAAIAQDASPKPVAKDENAPRWKRGLAGVFAVLLLAVGKLKFLILGLTKSSTFLSMLAFFGVYWSAFGWPLALGLVVSIYIHEMGHVAEIRRFGIAAGAPMFIPGLGALVRLRQHIDDPVVDARIGLAGPIWGLGAGIAAWLVARATGSHTWFAIAQLTGYINLFNLIPIWQLDGSRGFHALDRMARLIVVAATVAAFAVTGQRFLILIAAVAAFRAFRDTGTRTDRRTLVTFIGLIVLLSMLAEVRVATS